jgi:hypothetical protein
MTPKEKAKELYRKYWVYFTHEKTVNSIFQHAKECAIIAVDEIIQLDYNSLEYYGNLSSTEYYKEVKHEIENL